MTTETKTICDVCHEEIADHKLKVELRARYYRWEYDRPGRYRPIFINRDYHIGCYREAALPIIRNTPVDQP